MGLVLYTVIDAPTGEQRSAVEGRVYTTETLDKEDTEFDIITVCF